MEIMNLLGTLNKKKCQLVVTGDTFTVSGDYYYLVDKEFILAKDKQEVLSVKDYMGLNTLKKRSPKKMFQFIGIALALEIISTLADKIADIFFMFDTGWTSYFVNAVVLICVVIGLTYFFSKKKVYEISFKNKRICVDEEMFNYADIKKLDKILMDIR